MSGNSSTFLCGAPVCLTSRQQGIIALSVTEAELISAVSNVQDMLFVMRIVESVGLKVQKPMLLEVDNKGVVDLVNGWSIGGRTRHIDTRLNFLRELKEAEILEIKWCPNHEMSSDLFSKNLMGPEFERHTRTYCGEDEYYACDSQGEDVGMSTRGEIESHHTHKKKKSRNESFFLPKLQVENGENYSEQGTDGHIIFADREMEISLTMAALLPPRRNRIRSIYPKARRNFDIGIPARATCALRVLLIV